MAMQQSLKYRRYSQKTLSFFCKNPSLFVLGCVDTIFIGRMSFGWGRAFENIGVLLDGY